MNKITNTYNYKYSKAGALAMAGIVFDYDPLGNRLEKRDYRHHDTITDTTNYARDAQGNILAIYKRQRDSIWLNEFDIYGSKRIGVIDTTMLTGVTEVTCSCTPLANPFDSSRIGYLEGQRRYELDNHLGNVLVTVDDRKLPFDTTGTPNQANFYWANTISAQDYYPFGMVEPGRSYQLTGDSSYRYGFNGKMHDDEIYGKDNSYDYGMRMYDPRLGRFYSVDPLAKKYPHYSTYMYAGDKPINSIDIDGLEDKPIVVDQYSSIPKQKGGTTSTNTGWSNTTKVQVVHEEDIQTPPQDVTFTPTHGSVNARSEVTVAVDYAPTIAAGQPDEGAPVASGQFDITIQPITDSHGNAILDNNGNKQYPAVSVGIADAKTGEVKQDIFDNTEKRSEAAGTTIHFDLVPGEVLSITYQAGATLPVISNGKGQPIQANFTNQDNIHNGIQPSTAPLQFTPGAPAAAPATPAAPAASPTTPAAPDGGE
jgi:RHS repeat-associated protein